MSELRIRNFGESNPTDGGEEFLDFSGSAEQAPAEAEENQEIDLTESDESGSEEVTGEVENQTEPEEAQQTDELQDTPQQETSQEVVVDEEAALRYLNERLGTSFSSLEEVKSPKAGDSSNPLDSDPYLKGLYEWRQKTGRPIEDYLKYQKDYTQLGDVDVAREFLQHEYPTFTPEEIELELSRYLPSEYDTDSETALKQLEMKKLATRGRGVLSELKAELGEVSTTQLPPEVQEDLALAKEVKTLYEKQQADSKAYTESIKKVSSSIDSYDLELGDGLKVNYRLDEKSRAEIPQFVESMPHWRNPDGSWNHKAVVEDAIKIKHFDAMIKLAYEQGASSGKEEVIKAAKNTNFADVDPAGGQLNAGNKVQIEGLEDFLGNGGVKVRF